MEPPAASIITFPTDKRAQFTRASKPKTRTGCITCRRRHKKCDEAKPACLTCLKYKGFCEGYKSTAVKPSSQQRQQQQQRVLQPKPATEPKGNDMLVEPNYVSLIFSSQLEKESFDYWMAFSKTTTLFHSELITNLIPQISWNDPAIRHAALAVGAAALGSTTREQRLLGKGKFYADSLQHYGKSLNLLYSTPLSQERSLLACLLFIAFETLQGNRSAGLSHMNHGSRILDQYYPKHGAPSMLLEEVMSSFQHFGLQAWSHSVAHPRETKSRVPWCCRGRKAKYAVDEMPASFKNLDVARRWWDITRHYVKYHAPLKTSFEVAKVTSQPIDFAQLADYGSPKSQRRIRSFMRYLDAWHVGFAPLAVKSERQKHKNPQDFNRALALRIDYLNVWSGVRSGGWTDVEDIGRMEPAFRDIVKLSRQYLELQGQPSDGQERFTLEDSPTWALSMSFVMCNAPDLRDEVISLFEQYPRRDGLWDTRVFVALLQWMAKMTAGNFYPEGERHILGSKVVIYDHSSFVIELTRWDPVSSTAKTWNVNFDISTDSTEE
ncbi:C6 zinc finger protein [Colletotrichum truncatum]|uniref:C6 zinc finger protein n=1 Tax=Colletotrichum truncatum TaxID=5467 RepID=A0ACC3YHZ0_COLTU|nr:C6 zinc finger protein [Colletotrichum truncatum]KAF6792849.1 C6 zinc finger protein [Colletotrichum truncatum]